MNQGKKRKGRRLVALFCVFAMAMQTWPLGAYVGAAPGYDVSLDLNSGTENVGTISLDGLEFTPVHAQAVDEDVCTAALEDGALKVTAVGAGETTVQVADSADAATQSKEYTVIVTADATAVAITGKDSLPSSMTPEDTPPALSAATTPAAPYCNDAVEWSVSENSSGVSIDPATGALTLGVMTADSEEIIVTAAAGTASDSYTFTLNRVAPLVSWPASVNTEYGAVTELNVAPAGYDGALTFSVLTEQDTPSDAAMVNDGKLTILRANETFKLKVEGEASGNYSAFASTSGTYTTTARTLSVALAGLTLTKTSDGNDQLTAENLTALNEALAEYVAGAKVGQDDVAVTTTAQGAAYAMPAAGFGTTTVNDIPLELSGAASGNYVLASRSLSGVAAEILPVAPGAESAVIDLTTADSATMHGATFSAGMTADADGTLWLNATDNIAVTGAAAMSAGGSSITSIADPGTEVYILDAGDSKVYGPYTVRFQRDAAAPAVVISGAADGEMDLGNQAVTYTFTVSDEITAGVTGGVGVDPDGVFYFVGGAKPASDSSEWKKAALSGDPLGFSFEVTVPGSGQIFVKAADKAGNVRITDSLRSVVLEQDAPTLTSPVCAGADQYSNSHTVTLTAQDAAAEGTAPYGYSGLQKVYYSLTKEGESAPAAGFEQVEAFASQRPALMDDIPALRTKDLQIEVRGGALSGSYTMTVWALDWCGNTSAQQTIALNFDTVAPALAVQITEGEGYGEADYHNKGFDVTFTVTDDRTFEAADFTPVVEAQPSGANITFQAALAGDGKSCVYTAQVADSAPEGEYRFSISGTDKAGNALAEKYEADASVNAGQNAVSAVGGSLVSRTKILDTTAPQAVISYAAPAAEHIYGITAYHAQPIPVSVEFTDDQSLDGNKLNYGYGAGTLTADDALIADAAYPQELLHPTAQPGATQAQGTVTIDADGAYRLTISGTDKAGNPVVVTEKQDTQFVAQDVSTQDGAYESGNNLVLDTQAPAATVTLPALEDAFVFGVSCYYRQAPAVKLTVTDGERTLNGALVAYGVSDVQSAPLADDNTKITGNYSAADQTFTGDSNDSLTRTVTLPAADGVYQLRLKGEDKAGNKLEVTELREGASAEQQPATSAGDGYFTSSNLVLDTEAPTFRLSFAPAADVKNKAAVNGRYYFNGSFTAQVTVEDTNFDSSLVSVLRGVENSAGYDAGSVDIQTFGTAVAYDSQEMKYLDETVAEEGTYRYQISGTDKAGNPLTPAADNPELDGTAAIAGKGGEDTADLSRHVTVDRTAPDGVLSVSAGGEEFYQLALKTGTIETANPYREETSVQVSVTGEDPSPAMVKYTVVTVTGDPAAETIVGADAHATSGAQEYAWRNVLACEVGGDRIFRVTGIEVTDLAGNTTRYTRSNRIYLDGTQPVTDELAPNVSMEFGPVAEKKADAIDENNGPKGVPLFGADVPLRITVSDPNAGEKSSGLGEIVYQLYINGSETAADTVVLREASTTEWDENYSDPSLEFRLDQLLTVAADTHNYNDLRVVVTAKDNAGNTNIRELRFGIDTTAPVIEISYDNNDALNEKYFRSDRTATITVTERNFDPARISIDTQSGQRSGWTRTAGAAENGDDDRWSCTVSYTSDGNYTLSVSGQDLLGQEAASVTYNGTAPQEFVLDKTAPVVSVTFDNNDVRNGKYYPLARTATIQVNDNNFSGTNDIAVSATLGGTAPAVAFGGGVAILPFDTDGTYSFGGTVTDLAGNVSAPFTVEEFVIDQTAPTLTILGVEDGTAYPDEVAPEIAFSDQNYEGNTITLVRSALEQLNEDVTELLNPEGGVTAGEGGASSGTVRYADLEQTQENDGIYTLEAVVTDLAGNTTQQQVTYLVNRFGSVYVYSEALAAMVGQYQQKASDGLYITAYNVTPLVEGAASLQITCDGTNVAGQLSSADVTGAARQTETGWNEYRFDIDTRDLTQDGRYEIVLSDRDEAGNVKTNAEEPIWFYVDTTRPSLDSVVGLEEAIVNASSHTVSYTGSDAIALSSIKIYVDGEEVDSVTEFSDTSYEGSFVVGTGLRQNLRFVLVDKAGNVLDTDADFQPAYPFNRQLTVSTNLLIRWYANAPLFWGSIAVVVIAAGAGTFLLFRRHRRKEEAEML